MKTMGVILGMLLALGVSGCSGCGRWWNDTVNSGLGTDWVIVQYDSIGHPINCWELHDVSVVNEGNSDGIQWRDPTVGMVHMGGWYTRIQVDNGNFDAAHKHLGTIRNECPGGRYEPTPRALTE